MEVCHRDKNLLKSSSLWMGHIELRQSTDALWDCSWALAQTKMYLGIGLQCLWWRKCLDLFGELGNQNEPNQKPS